MSKKTKHAIIDLTLDDDSKPEPPVSNIVSLGSGNSTSNGAALGNASTAVEDKRDEDQTLVIRRLQQELERTREQLQHQRAVPVSPVSLDSSSDSKMPARTLHGSREFDESTLLLNDSSSEPGVRTVSVAKPIADCLKDHQKEGLRSLWRNSFSDCAHATKFCGDGLVVGGSVLAHEMVSSSLPLYR